MAFAEPKSSHCDGWGYEPVKIPLEDCSRCRGSGRPTSAAAASLGDLGEQNHG